MGVGTLISAGVAFATTLIPNLKVWTLSNLDSGDTLQGQFHAEELVENISVSWGKFTSLNRQNPISQFLHGNSDELSFTGKFIKYSAFPTEKGNPKKHVDILKSWARIDSSILRPPILQFWVGDGHVKMTCYISDLSISYEEPDFFGQLNYAIFRITLHQFTTFSLDDEEQTDTRYAYAKEREYYELLCQREYNNPMTGDAIRKMHPQYQSLQPGNIVKLPSIEGVRTIEITQTSGPLKTAFGKKNTAQKRLRISTFENRSGSYVSHTI